MSASSARVNTFEAGFIGVLSRMNFVLGEKAARSAAGESVHSGGAIRTSFASASRKALASWQSSAGLVPTGYLNGGQLELLNRQSQPLYDAWVQQGRPELASLQSADGDGSGDRQPAPARAQRQQSDGGSGRGGGNPAAGAAEALGVARQIIGRGVPRLPGF